MEMEIQENTGSYFMLLDLFKSDILLMDHKLTGIQSMFKILSIRIISI